MINDEMRNKIVEEAKTWLDTPYHHLGDVKGAGVDCAMLLVRVYCDLGIAPKFDPRPYPAQWYFHQDEERYIAWLEKYCDRTDVALAGDIALYQFGRCASHGAIILNDELMIHSFSPARKVEIRERRAPLPHGKFHSFWTVRT